MKFEDILALAKQGYKPSDIKELMALSNEEPVAPSNPSVDAGQSQGEGQTVEGTAQPEKPTEPTEPIKPMQEPDYKAMYEEQQKQIKALQQAQTKVDLSDKDKKSDIDTFNNLMQSFM